jgi:hypothetical protein
MIKGTYERTNKGLGCKLTNFISFGESIIFAGYIQKIIKGAYMSEEIMQFYRETNVGSF